MPRAITLRREVILRLSMKLPTWKSTMDYENQLSMLLRWARRIHGLQVTELAKDIGVCATTLKAARRTDGGVTTATLIKIHDWVFRYFRLKVELDDLVELVGRGFEEPDSLYRKVAGDARRVALGE